MTAPKTKAKAPRKRKTPPAPAAPIPAAPVPEAPVSTAAATPRMDAFAALGVEGKPWEPPNSTTAPDFDGGPPLGEPEVPTWTVDKTKRKLREWSAALDALAGARLHAEMTMQPGEIDGMAPFLTTIINRRPTLRRVAETSEGFSFAMSLLGYGSRVAGERAAHGFLVSQGMLQPGPGRASDAPPDVRAAAAAALQGE